MKRAQKAAAVLLALVVMACGGAEDGAGEGLGEDVFDGIGAASGDVGADETGSSNGSEVGPVTQTADPSTAWVEVDGERYDLEAVGSVNYRCEVLDDRITVNFQQTTSGNDLTLQGSVLDGQWTANLTFAPEDGQVSYGATIGFDPGTLGIGSGEISYEGSMSRVEDFDIQNAEDVQGTMAVNCADPGDGTTADVGGQSFDFPFNGASSLTCRIGENEAEVLVGRSQPQFTQLQVDVRPEGDGLFGAVIITAGDQSFSSFIPPDGSGFEFDGDKLTYEGLFTTSDDEEVDGSISVSCG